MVKIILGFLLFYLTLSAMEFEIGIGANLGMGFSKYDINVIDPEGNLLADHLASREPNFGMESTIQFWFTKTWGIQTGLQYGWYNYNYTYDYRTGAEAIVYKWNYKSLIFPIELILGFPIGKNRFVIGSGLIVSKQLKGERSGKVWGMNLETEELADDLLKTSVHPKILIGAELLSGNIRLQPSVSYIYGLDGVDKQFDSGCSTHHILAGISILYVVGK